MVGIKFILKRIKINLLVLYFSSNSSVCSTQFCWLCIKKASELHYLSPTGCKFV